jgi:chlorosome envelope protein H
MATEEPNKPAGTQPSLSADAKTNAGSGDMAHLIENMGVLIDSTIESVQGMISSVSSATGQLLEGVTSTMNSEPVREIINNVNSVSGQLIEGVTATLKSEPVQNSFHELGKFWENLLVSLNSTVNSDQVKNLFENVSMGLGQLVSNVFSTTIPSFGMGEERKKHIQEIPLLSAKEHREPLQKDTAENKPKAG